MTRFLPSREPIEAFGSGGFRFGGMSHRGSLLVLPSGMRAWPVTALRDVTPEHLVDVTAEAASIDMLLIGSGSNMEPFPASAAKALRDCRISFDVTTTSAAIHVYNIVLLEGRRVAAALIEVADAKS